MGCESLLRPGIGQAESREYSVMPGKTIVRLNRSETVRACVFSCMRKIQDISLRMGALCACAAYVKPWCHEDLQARLAEETNVGRLGVGRLVQEGLPEGLLIKRSIRCQRFPHRRKEEPPPATPHKHHYKYQQQALIYAPGSSNKADHPGLRVKGALQSAGPLSTSQH